MSSSRRRQSEPSVGAISASVRREPLFPQGGTKARKKRGESVTLTATPKYKNLIWVVDDFLTPSECAAWIAYGERQGFEASRQAATRDTAFRENGRVEVWCEDTARRIWERMRGLVPKGLCDGEATGCFPKIRLYEYGVGQRFGKHVDESVEFGQAGQWMTGVTVLVYLGEEGLEGGETVFYDGRRDEKVAFSFSPKPGSLLFHGYVFAWLWNRFIPKDDERYLLNLTTDDELVSAFSIELFIKYLHGRHGNLCLTHEAQVVKAGTKYVLRTDVAYATGS